MNKTSKMENTHHEPDCNSVGTSPRNIDDAAVKLLNEGQRGFTLIELMVGLVLGLLASLAVFTAVSSFETQRRITAAGADMQQNGLLALYFLEQDIRMAGFGLIDASTKPGRLPCVRLGAAGGQFRSIAPVSIVDGGAGSDSITTHLLDAANGGIANGGIVTGGGAAKLTSPLPASVPFTVDTNRAIQANDYLLIPDNHACTLLRATVVPTSTAPAVPVTQDSAPTPQDVSIINLGSLATAPTSATLAPDLTYSIDANFNLVNSLNGAVASNIVNMQVEYGVANAGTQSVTCWTDASNNNACGGTDWRTSLPGVLPATPSAADIKRIKAIRVAIIARSSQKAADNTCVATAAPSSWAAIADTANANFAPQSGIANWGWGGCYRYKIYQTIIPIRNVIWGNLQ